jgi:beta-lactamase class A
MAAAAGLERPSIVLARLRGGARAGRGDEGSALAGAGAEGVPAVPGALEEARLAPEAEHYPASMIKTPIAACLAERWVRGSHHPGDRAVVTTTNMTANDKPSPFVPGYAASLDELATLMIVRSDNVATNVLIDVLGRHAITIFCERIGLTRTAVRRKLSGSLPLIEDAEATGRNSHPISDAALLFGAIERRALPGSEWLAGVLEAQEWNDKLSLGLQPGDRFAHKTGDTDEVSHDGGILDTVEGRRYLLVVYSALPSSPESDERFGSFMRALRPRL